MNTSQWAESSAYLLIFLMKCSVPRGYSASKCGNRGRKDKMSYDPLEYHPRHYSMDELQQQIREGIVLQGFAIRHVLSDGIHPPFSYTVGLYEAHAPFPELVISGLSMVTRNGFLLQLGYAMKGPPSPQVRRAMAQELGVRKKDLRIPSGGIRLSPGKIYRQFTGNGLPMCFAQVEQRYYLDLFGQAVVFHGHEH